MASGPAFLFDLDGTLVDSVYQHVLAWQDALDRMGIELAVWRIHRKIGMSGGLFANALLRETGRAVTTEEADRLRRYHGEAYAARAEGVRPLPGAVELLAYLTEIAVPWAIATSGYIESAGPTIEALGVPPDVPVITRDQVAHAKPDPDLFLAAADRLEVDILESIVVGDSVWDLLAARRARALSVGLLSGGYGQVELERAGAYRVYEEPADLLRHLDEVGVRARILRRARTRTEREEEPIPWAPLRSLRVLSDGCGHALVEGEVADDVRAKLDPVGHVLAQPGRRDRRRGVGLRMGLPQAERQAGALARVGESVADEPGLIPEGLEHAGLGFLGDLGERALRDLVVRNTE